MSTTAPPPEPADEAKANKALASDLVRIIPKRLRRSLSKIFGLKGNRFPFALWMHDGRLRDSSKRIRSWEKNLSRTSKTSKSKNRLLKFHHLVEIADAIEELSTHTAGDEPVGLPLDFLNLAYVYESLWLAHNLDRLFKKSNQTELNYAIQLVGALWTIGGRAQSTPSTMDCLTKSLGIELGVTLCLQESNGHSAKTLDLLHEHHLLEEFESLLESQLDGDGWPASRLLPHFGMTSASWVRSFLLLESVQAEFDYEIVLQVEWMVRQLLRMRRYDGTLVFCHPQSHEGASEFWDVLKSVSSDDDDRILFRTIKKQSRGVSKQKQKRLIDKAEGVASPHNVSEWSGSALLRSSWSPESSSIGIDFSKSASTSKSCVVDIAGKKQLFSGDTMPRITIEDQELQFHEDFEVVCERFDEDLDFVEIQISTYCPSNVDAAGTLNRQFLLSKEDDFLLMIDTVIPPENRAPKSIDYHCKWPISSGMEPLCESETREVYLQTSSKGKKIQALVLPLGLPEWKTARSNGKLEASQEALTLSQSCKGAGLVVPYVIDLSPKRSRKKRTWRQLTVAQNRTSVPPDHGVAFRFQLDNSQWFFYRAVATTGNRTFLGENSIAEFVFNKFDPDGTVTQLLEVK